MSDQRHAWRMWPVMAEKKPLRCFLAPESFLSRSLYHISPNFLDTLFFYVSSSPQQSLGGSSYPLQPTLGCLVQLCAGDWGSAYVLELVVEFLLSGIVLHHVAIGSDRRSHAGLYRRAGPPGRCPLVVRRASAAAQHSRPPPPPFQFQSPTHSPGQVSSGATLPKSEGQGPASSTIFAMFYYGVQG